LGETHLKLRAKTKAGANVQNIKKNPTVKVISGKTASARKQKGGIKKYKEN